MALAIVPINLRDANAFVACHHRNHKPTPGCKFCIAVADGDAVVGVAIVGRPVSRRLDNGWTLEVNRTCVLEGARNANSALYGAAWRAARAMGYRRLITYTLPSESGASLRGAGWQCIGERGGGNWNVPSRPRVDSELTGGKLLWEAVGPHGRAADSGLGI